MFLFYLIVQVFFQISQRMYFCQLDQVKVLFFGLNLYDPHCHHVHLSDAEYDFKRSCFSMKQSKIYILIYLLLFTCPVVGLCMQESIETFDWALPTSTVISEKTHCNPTHNDIRLHGSSVLIRVESITNRRRRSNVNRSNGSWTRDNHQADQN